MKTLKPCLEPDERTPEGVQIWGVLTRKGAVKN
jgi:hypothetical protein